MKKLLKVSLVAILAVGPVAAFAGTLPAKYTDNQSATKPQLTASNVLATKTYVQGAYNELVESINLEDQKVGALDSATLTAFGANTPASLAAAVNSAMAAAQTAQAGNGLNEDAVNAQINEAAGNGLSTSADGVLAVNLGENKGLEINSDALEVKTGAGLTVDSTGVHLTEAVQSSIALANSALQSTSTLNGAKLDTGTVAKTALAEGVQSSLALADSALQSTDIGSGLAWDSTTGVSLSAENQAKIDSAITKNVDDLTNYTTTTAMNNLLSGKQDKIDSTHKLSVDLIDGGVVAANTWGSDTTVLVNLSSSAN